MAAWWHRNHGRPGVQVVLALAIGVAAFALAALVSPPLRELDADAVVVLGIFVFVSVLVAKIAARAGRRADESEQARGLLADEQAALSRVATLVARGVPSEELFAAVTEEARRLLSVKHVGLGRYESDGAFTIVAWSGPSDFDPPIGGRQMLGGNNVSTLVYETGRPARIEDYGGASGPIGVAAREDGVGSGVGTPVIVDGRLWGVMATYSPVGQPLPADTEARLATFTELVATAIANAESHAGLSRLAEEQAALRRVATLVARGVPPEEVFAVVTREVGRLLGTDLAGMARYESPDTVTVLATWAAEGELARAHPLVPGPWPLEGGDVASTVSRTAKPVRIDDYDGVPGRIAAFVREELGIRSSVASPIAVEGRLWGILFVHSKQTEPLPLDTESRLTGFTELVATLIANAENRSEVAASRARIVAASDETRRRIERDLHDGTQQRLISLALKLRGMEAAVASEGGDLSLELSRVGEELADVLEDLRTLSRGLHPVILSEAGLRPALKALARRSAVPVELDVRVEARLPESIEVAAYYVISEGLANAVKHADASVVKVDVEVVEGCVRISICDDGQGGADPAGGSGLIGLKDRVEAQGGTISVVSPPDEGTRLNVSLPVGAADEPVNSWMPSSGRRPVSARS